MSLGGVLGGRNVARYDGRALSRDDGIQILFQRQSFSVDLGGRFHTDIAVVPGLVSVFGDGFLPFGIAENKAVLMCMSEEVLVGRIQGESFIQNRFFGCIADKIHAKTGLVLALSRAGRVSQNDLFAFLAAEVGVVVLFHDIDIVVEHFDLVLVGARPGMGKTSFCLNIAANVAAQTGKKVCIFSLEMSAEQLVNRMISSEAMVDSYKLRTGELTPEDWDNVAAAAARLAKCEILIDDTSGITVTGMKAKLRRVDDLGLVVIDYLQLMQGDKHTDNRVSEVGEISRGMKIMAKELMVPVICCSQLNRGVEGRSEKRPMMSDLRESGSIEQDADVIMLLFRDEYYKINESDTPNTDAESNIVEVIVAKNRHGSTATVKMGWIGRYTKFRSLADERQLPQ